MNSLLNLVLNVQQALNLKPDRSESVQASPKVLSFLECLKNCLTSEDNSAAKITNQIATSLENPSKLEKSGSEFIESSSDKESGDIDKNSMISASLLGGWAEYIKNLIENIPSHKIVDLNNLIQNKDLNYKQELISILRAASSSVKENLKQLAERLIKDQPHLLKTQDPASETLNQSEIVTLNKVYNLLNAADRQVELEENLQSIAKQEVLNQLQALKISNAFVLDNKETGHIAESGKIAFSELNNQSNHDQNQNLIKTLTNRSEKPEISNSTNSLNQENYKLPIFLDLEEINAEAEINAKLERILNNVFLQSFNTKSNNFLKVDLLGQNNSVIDFEILNYEGKLNSHQNLSNLNSYQSQAEISNYASLFQKSSLINNSSNQDIIRETASQLLIFDQETHKPIRLDNNLTLNLEFNDSINTQKSNLDSDTINNLFSSKTNLKENIPLKQTPVKDILSGRGWLVPAESNLEDLAKTNDPKLDLEQKFIKINDNSRKDADNQDINILRSSELSILNSKNQTKNSPVNQQKSDSEIFSEKQITESNKFAKEDLKTKTIPSESESEKEALSSKKPVESKDVFTNKELKTTAFDKNLNQNFKSASSEELSFNEKQVLKKEENITFKSSNKLQEDPQKLPNSSSKQPNNSAQSRTSEQTNQMPKPNNDPAYLSKEENFKAEKSNDSSLSNKTERSFKAIKVSNENLTNSILFQRFQNLVNNLTAKQQPTSYLKETVLKQIQDYLDSLGNFEKGQVSILLRPPQLGRIIFQLETIQGNATAFLKVNSSEVRTILENSKSALREILTNQGYKIEQIKVEILSSNSLKDFSASRPDPSLRNSLTSSTVLTEDTNPEYSDAWKQSFNQNHTEANLGARIPFKEDARSLQSIRFEDPRSNPQTFENLNYLINLVA